MVLLYILLTLILVFILIIAIKTYHFKPQPLDQPNLNKPAIDDKKAIAALQAMLKIKTVSYEDKSKEDKKAFDAFKDLLLKNYPNINEHAKFMTIGETGLLFKLKGQNNSEPIVLMSHYDVVPQNGQWQKDPFCGEMVEGKIYGRGAIDTKATLAAIMEATEARLKEKKALKRDLYLAFSGDEETRGPSAPTIVDYLKNQGIKPWLVLDEGGAIVKDAFKGVEKPAAFIGLAEKGYVNIKIEANVQGGHASMPPKVMAVSKLAKAVRVLNKDKTFKKRLPEPTKLMFDALARHSKNSIIRIAFANLWCFWPIIKWQARKSPLLASLLKTTQAFTMMEASDAMNVLPSSAHLGINYRIISGETKESVLNLVKSKVEKYGLTVTMEKGADPTSISEMGPSYHVLEETIKDIFGEVIITPYLMMAGTDARYHHDISKHVYRFSPMLFTKEDRSMIHGVDEAVRVESYLDCVAFYNQLLSHIT